METGDDKRCSMRTVWMYLLLLTGGWSLPAGACDAPVPLPAGAWDWGPLCTVVQADEHLQESVLARTSADLRTTVEAGRSPFQTHSLIPLGFSETGTFAWLSWEPPCGEDCGEAGVHGKWTIRVLDPSTGQRTSAAAYPDSGGGLDALLAEHGDSVQSVARAHAIALGIPEILALPAESGGQTIAVEWRPQASVGRFSVWLREGSGAPRAIGELELGGCKLCGPHHARLISSPLDKTAMLVLVHFSARLEHAIPDVTYTVLPVSLGDRGASVEPEPK